MTATPRRAYKSSTKSSVAVGVTTFAGFMLSIVGIFQILQGIAAIAKDDIYVTGGNYVYRFDVTTWGWIHLVVGIIAVAVAIGILLGQTWGRAAGIGLAVVSAITNFAFLPYYPVWSLIVIAFSALVIWALCVQLSKQTL